MKVKEIPIGDESRAAAAIEAALKGHQDLTHFDPERKIKQRVKRGDYDREKSGNPELQDW